MAVRIKARNTPTDRTLAYLDARGWVADIAERRQGRITRDWRGCIDIIAFHVKHPPKLIQVTSRSNAASRRAKIRANAGDLEALPASIELWTWTPQRPDPWIEVVFPAAS